MLCKLEADSPSTDSAAPAKTGFNGNPVKEKKTELRKCDQGSIKASSTMTCKFKWPSIKCRICHLCFGSSDPTGYYTSTDHNRIRHRTVNKVNGYGVDDRRQAFPFTKFNPALKARRLNGQNVKVVTHFHLRMILCGKFHNSVPTLHVGMVLKHRCIFTTICNKGQQDAEHLSKQSLLFLITPNLPTAR
jgi:hypothetical protein